MFALGQREGGNEFQLYGNNRNPYSVLRAVAVYDHA